MSPAVVEACRRRAELAFKTELASLTYAFGQEVPLAELRQRLRAELMDVLLVDVALEHVDLPAGADELDDTRPFLRAVVDEGGELDEAELDAIARCGWHGFWNGSYP